MRPKSQSTSKLHHKCFDIQTIRNLQKKRVRTRHRETSVPDCRALFLGLGAPSSFLPPVGAPPSLQGSTPLDPTFSGLGSPHSEPSSLQGQRPLHAGQLSAEPELRRTALRWTAQIVALRDPGRSPSIRVQRKKEQNRGL